MMQRFCEPLRSVPSSGFAVVPLIECVKISALDSAGHQDAPSGSRIGGAPFSLHSLRDSHDRFRFAASRVGGVCAFGWSPRIGDDGRVVAERRQPRAATDSVYYGSFLSA
jgi:hypothetical protein